MTGRDHQLKLSIIPVNFKKGAKGNARAEGNNAAWNCSCGEAVPLIGRCYYQFGDTCFTVCPACSAAYRIVPDKKKRATRVDEA